MLRWRFLLPVLLLPVAACSAVAGGSPVPASTPASTPAPQPVGCEIRVSDTALGWQVEPVAVSATPLKGSYDFTVSKVSRGGTSISTQSGDFASVPGKPTILGSAVFDRKGSIAAKLTVRWSGGAVSCVRRYPGA